MAAVKAKKTPKKLKVGKKKSVNKWLVLGGIAAVVAIGVAVVRFSSASTITFYRDIKQFTGYKQYIKRSNNITYLAVNDVESGYDSVTATYASVAEIRKSTLVCAKVLNFSNYDHFVYIQVTGKYSSSDPQVKEHYLEKKSTKHICVRKKYIEDSRISIYVQYDAGKDIGIAGVYGYK